MGSIKVSGQDPAFFSSCRKKTNIYVFTSSEYSGILSSFSTRYPTLKSENTSYKYNHRMECIREANARHKVIIFCKSHPFNYQLEENTMKSSNKRPETSMTRSTRVHHDYKAP